MNEQYNLRTVVFTEHGLPYMSRTIEEMVDDFETEKAFLRSQEMSMERRIPAGYRSEVVMSGLDAYSEIQQKIVKDMARYFPTMLYNTFDEPEIA